MVFLILEIFSTELFKLSSHPWLHARQLFIEYGMCWGPDVWHLQTSSLLWEFYLLSPYGVRYQDMRWSRFVTWNTPAHLSMVDFDLVNSLDPSTCCTEFYERNGWKFAILGDLTAGGTMKTQLPFPLPGRRLLLSCPDIIPCNSVL